MIRVLHYLQAGYILIVGTGLGYKCVGQNWANNSLFCRTFCVPNLINSV